MSFVSRKHVTRFFLGVLLLAGLWLLGRAVSPSPEGVARTHALGALAPAAVPSQQDAPVPLSGVVEPVAVDLATIPPGVHDPDNQYDRWLRGEIDLDGEMSIVSGAEVAALQAAARALPPDDDIQVAGSPPGAAAPTPGGTSFDSIDITGCCGPTGGNVPPDPELAVGPNHIIAVVNVAFEIYSTAGASLAGPITFASFMGVDPNCTGVFDPNVLYDEQMDRFVLAIDANGAFYCVAVSQTSNPLGAWWIYSFPTGNGGSVFFDYPHAGIGNDAIFMGANIFNGSSFTEGRVYAMDKNAMYVGGAAGFLVNGLGATQDTPQPMNLHGFNQGTWPASLVHSILTETNYNGANHTLFQWNGPFSGPNSFGAVAAINLNTATGVVAGYPINVIQAGGGGTIQANDWRPLDFEYRNGYAWTTATIACNPGGGTVDCVRWAQIDVTTTPGAIGPEGAGVYASGGDYRFFPDLAVNHCDDMAIGYTKSNANIFPAIWVNGRESGVDAAGTLQAETQMKVGEITYTAFDGAPRRWGDYTGMTIAPDGLTFWYLGEYSKNTGSALGRWGTFVGSYVFPNCAVVPTSVTLQSSAAGSTPAALPWTAVVLLAALTLLPALARIRPKNM